MTRAMRRAFHRYAGRVCPSCGTRADKVIYMGLPMKLCRADNCRLVWGFWAHVMVLLPFNGWFMTYTDAYIPALWHWLTSSAGDD